jgi:hypothetical protein
MSAGATFGKYVASSLAAYAACAHRVAHIKSTAAGTNEAALREQAAIGLQTMEHLNEEPRPVRARMPSDFNADAGLSPLTALSHGLSQRKLTCRKVVYLVMAVELAFALDQTVGRWINAAFANLTAGS